MVALGEYFIVTALWLCSMFAISSQTPCANYPNHTIDSTGRDLILKIHNQKRVATATAQYRNGVNKFKIRHAKNIMEMKYDCELEKAAHDIAVQCNDAETPQTSLTTEGENFLKIDKVYSEIGTASNAMYTAGTKWFDEITKNGINQNIDFTQYFANKKPTVYHWSQTYKIGCEIADCEDLKNKQYTIVVCRYSPKGNVVGTKVYQPGQKLDCTYGTSVGYPSL
ncbi:unnamed protein product [Cylicocyclus nassatus]|uniref:SCP domain-containing protein n=1 Tax=Cylicocyclus nassatus TaxID=53992 RepID=A0AA36DP40_CYLNA|nr:unnamed protein product [Cylicocyclus nassatus]